MTVTPIDRHGEPAEQVDVQGRQEKRSQAARLVDLAHELYELGVTEEGRAFAVPKAGPRVVRAMRGGRPSFIGELGVELYRRTGGKVIATANARKDAGEHLAAEAEAMPRRRLAARVARPSDGTLVLDLGDETGRAVVITREGWRVEDQAPVLFARTPQTLPLPIPGHGGSLDPLWSLVNVAPASRQLYLAALVSYFFPSMDHPILDMSGEAGAGKTTTARNTARLIDPSAAPLARMPTREQDLDIVASQSYVLAFDNLSRIEEWQSDALCAFVTGVSAVRRELYSDAGLSMLKVRLCAILTSIDYGTPKPDLAQRLLPTRMSVVTDDQRRDEEQIDDAFRAAHPGVLGALLDLAVAALRELPAVDAAVDAGALRLPRLAGFGRICAALDRAEGTNRLAAYRELLTEQAVDAATDDEVASAVREFVLSLAAGSRKRDGWDPDAQTWRGTPTELHSALSATFDRSKFWPATAAAFGKRLSVMVGPLRSMGIEVRRERDTSTRTRTKAVVLSVIPAPAAAPPAPPATPPESACTVCPAPGPSCGIGLVDESELPCVLCEVPTLVRARCGAARHHHCRPGPADSPSPAPADDTSPADVSPVVADDDPVPAPALEKLPAPAAAAPPPRLRSHPKTVERAQSKADALDQAKADLRAGRDLMLLRALEGPYAPLRVDPATGRRMRPYWRPAHPGVTWAVHAVEAWGWTRSNPPAGPVAVLDRNGSFISAASSVLVAHGALEHTGPLPAFDPKRPGYYEIDVHPWHAGDELPNPLMHVPKRRETVWVTAPTVALLAELERDGRWPDLTIRDSYTSAGVRIDEWARFVNELRALALSDEFGRESEQYEHVKERFSMAVQLMLGAPADNNVGREWKCGAHRPDWTQTIRAQAAASLWRWADDCRQLCPDAPPIALRNTDELVLPAAALDIVTTQPRPGGRKPMVIDQRGVQLGTFKVKHLDSATAGDEGEAPAGGES